MYLHTTTDGEGERARKEEKKVGEREKKWRNDTVVKKRRKSTALGGVCRCNTRVPRVAGRLASRVAK